MSSLQEVCWYTLPLLYPTDTTNISGGPAGCVVAGRLAKADPNLQVMLIEYGQNNIDVCPSASP